MAIVRDASSPARFAIGTVSGTESGTSASFTPPANSLVRVSVCINSNTSASPTFNVPTFSGSGLAAFTLVKSQVNASGGSVAIFQSQAGASPTAGTVSVSITNTGGSTVSPDSAAWVDVWTGADSSQTGAATASNTSGTQNISPTITTTRTGSQVHGVAIDWNANGNPTSTDTSDPFTVAGQTSGTRAYKASNSGAAGSVALNFNAAGAPIWTYALAEILAPSAGGTTTTKTMSETTSVSDQALDVAMRVRQQSDSAALNDQLIYGARRGNITSDGILTSDGTVSGAKRGVVASESLTVLDDDFQYLRRVRQGSDSASVTDGFVSWRRLARVSQDNIDVLDGFSRTVSGSGTVYGKVMSDTLDVTEGFVSWRRLKRLMADNADVLDGFSKTLVGVGIVYAKVMSDVTTLVDDNGQRWVLRTSRLTDAVGLSDAVLRALARIRILGENLEFSDGVIRFLRAVRVSTETLDIADELVRSYFADQIFNVALVFGHREVMRMSHYDPMNFAAHEPSIRFGGH